MGSKQARRQKATNETPRIYGNTCDPNTDLCVADRALCLFTMPTLEVPATTRQAFRKPWLPDFV